MRHLGVLLTMLLVVGVSQCLAFDASICNPGATISYYPNGQLKTCTLEDMLIVDDVEITCSELNVISFYELGGLRSCVTSGFYRYQGVVCGDQSDVSFYPSGKLDSCILARQVEVEGKTCVEHERISFFENGKLKTCTTPR